MHCAILLFVFALSPLVISSFSPYQPVLIDGDTITLVTNNTKQLIVEYDGTVGITHTLQFAGDTGNTVPCDAGHRGTMNFLRGESGTSDKFQVCIRNSDGNYEWQNGASGGGGGGNSTNNPTIPTATGLLVGAYTLNGNQCETHTGAVVNCTCVGSVSELVDSFSYLGQSWRLYFCFTNTTNPAPFGQGMIVGISNYTERGVYPSQGCEGLGVFPITYMMPVFQDGGLGSYFPATANFATLLSWIPPYPQAFYYLAGGYSSYSGSYLGGINWGVAKNNGCPSNTISVKFTYSGGAVAVVVYCVTKVPTSTFF